MSDPRSEYGLLENILLQLSVKGGGDATKYLDGTGNFSTPSGDGGSVLTTKGDLLGFSTLAARIPVGTNGQVLTADSTQALGLKWATPSGGASPLTTKGDVYTRSASADARLAVGTDGQLLAADSTQANGLKWVAPPSGTLAIGSAVGSGHANRLLYQNGSANLTDSAFLTFNPAVSTTANPGIRLDGGNSPMFNIGMDYATALSYLQDPSVETIYGIFTVWSNCNNGALALFEYQSPGAINDCMFVRIRRANGTGLTTQDGDQLGGFLFEAWDNGSPKIPRVVGQIFSQLHGAAGNGYVPGTITFAHTDYDGVSKEVFGIWNSRLGVGDAAVTACLSGSLDATIHVKLSGALDVTLMLEGVGDSPYCGIFFKTNGVEHWYTGQGFNETSHRYVVRDLVANLDVMELHSNDAGTVRFLEAVLVGAATGGAEGTGTINVSGNYYVNGVAIDASSVSGSGQTVDNSSTVVLLDYDLGSSNIAVGFDLVIQATLGDWTKTQRVHCDIGVVSNGSTYTINAKRFSAVDSSGGHIASTFDAVIVGTHIHVTVVGDRAAVINYVLEGDHTVQS